MILASSVSVPVFSAVYLKLPVPLIVPAYTLLPVFFSTGSGSPLNIDSSTYDIPSYRVPSTAILSPGRTISLSPGIIASMLTTVLLPSLSIFTTVFGCSPISFLMADDVLLFALLSSVRPSNMNAMMTAEASKYTCGIIPCEIQ